MLRTTGAWVAFLICGVCASLAVSTTSRDFSVPAGTAEQTLRLFARQAGEPFLFPVSLVRGVRTKPVNGSMSPDSALAGMLAESGLEAVRDPQTGLLGVRRSVRRVPVAAAEEVSSRVAAAKDRTAIVEPPIELETYRVEQRRDAGLVTQSILRTDARAPLYHDVMTRRQVEQLGVTSVAELMTLVAGYSGEGIENVQSSADSAVVDGNVALPSGAFLKLRGFDSMRATVLLNGRRLPGSLDARGVDLSRVPLAAVERVEVLPLSGSAVYGDNVIGGAVNIILRHDYTERSVTVQAGTSTRGGGREFSVTLADGFAAADGRTKVALILEYAERSALRQRDGGFLERALAQRPLAETLALSHERPAGQLASRMLRNLVSAVLPGSPAILEVSEPLNGGPAVWKGTAYLVPIGQNGAHVTPDTLSPLDAGVAARSRDARSVLRRPAQTAGFTAEVEHTFGGGACELYAEIGYSRVREAFTAPYAVPPIALSPVDDFNPFRGTDEPRYAMLYLDPVDLPDSAYEQRREGGRVVLGLRGDLSHDWRWTVDGSVDRLDSRLRLESPSVMFNQVMQGGRSQFTAAEVRAIYDPLADHRAYPISAAAIERNFRYGVESRGWTELKGVSARVFGPALALPAGRVRVSLRGELENESQVSDTVTRFSDALVKLTPQYTTFLLRTAPRHARAERTPVAGIGEATVPLVSDRWRPIPLESADLEIASRASFGSQGTRYAASTAGLKLGLLPGLSVRGSVSQGCLPPPLSALNDPVRDMPSAVAVQDPRHGRAYRSGFLIREGGNPALRAETSVSESVGVQFEPRRWPGFMFSADAWRIHVRDGIRVLRAQEAVDHEAEVPGVVERYEEIPPPAVPPHLPGDIRLIDGRPLNFAETWSEGVDLSAMFPLGATRAGQFALAMRATYVRRYDERLFAGEPPADLRGVVSGDNRGFGAASPLLPKRGSVTLLWSRDRWRASVTGRYLSPYTAKTLYTVPRGESTTFAEVFDVSGVGSSAVWDVQLIRQAPERRDGNAWDRAFGAMTWTFGVRNLFDRMPPYRADGVAFYSRFDDPRMRFVYVRIQRTF